MNKKIVEIINNPLFSGSALMIIGSNTVNALNYFYHLIMGRLLGPAGYGELAALISLIGLFSVIPISISVVVTKYVSATSAKSELNNLISWLRKKIFQLSIIFFILILVISPAIGSFLHIDRITYLILIGISFLFSLSAVLNRAVLQGLLKFRENILTIFIETGTKLLVSIVLVLLGFYIFGAMTALVTSAVVGWYLTHRYLSTFHKKNPIQPKIIRSMMVFSIPVIVQSISITSLYTADLILVKHFFSAHDAGLYAALSTLGKIIFFGTGPISTVMFPIVSKKHAKGENYKQVFKYSLIATAFLSLCVLVIYWLLPSLAINLLYGSDYLAAANLLVWFGIFMTFFTLSSLLINFNLSLGKTQVVLPALVAALAQIVGIWSYHDNLFSVILISTVVAALLMISLFIYSTYGKKFSLPNKSYFDNSPRL